MKKDEKAKNGKEKKLDVYRPFEALDRMDDFFDYATKIPYKLLNNYFSSYKTPDADVIDNGDFYTVKIDLPGIDKKNIKLKILGDSIEVRAEKNEEKEERRGGYYSKERASMGYYRSIPLPEKIKPKSAKAKMENGTLKIDVEKSEETKGNEVSIE